MNDLSIHHRLIVEDNTNWGIIKKCNVAQDVEIFLEDHAGKHSRMGMTHDLTLLLRKAFRNGFVTSERENQELKSTISDLKKQLESLVDKLK